MAETYPKSKLKRKKGLVEELHTETPKTSLPTRCHSDRSGVSAVSWWSREDLPASDSLWAQTLRSALPYLQSQHWDLVPDLPHPSSANPSSHMLDEQHWCDLSEEVAPLPESSPCFPRPPPSPDSPSLSSPHQAVPVQTKPLPNSTNSVMSSHGGLSHKSKRMYPQALTKRHPESPSERQPSLHSWAVREPLPGPSSLGKEKGRNGQEKEEGKIKTQPLTTHGKVFDCWAALQREGEKKEDREGQVPWTGRRGGGDGGERGEELQSCPMCLIVFPVGFTQMDRDGHLAQCLSEMNVDMTW